eukprot:COSAG01_NODE_1083_length_11812_cov_9.648510_2_plen_111_part_00
MPKVLHVDGAPPPNVIITAMMGRGMMTWMPPSPIGGGGGSRGVDERRRKELCRWLPLRYRRGSSVLCRPVTNLGSLWPPGRPFGSIVGLAAMPARILRSGREDRRKPTSY